MTDIEKMSESAQIGYWQRRCEIAEEEIERLRKDNDRLRAIIERAVDEHPGFEPGKVA